MKLILLLQIVHFILNILNFTFCVCYSAMGLVFSTILSHLGELNHKLHRIHSFDNNISRNAYIHNVHKKYDQIDNSQILLPITISTKNRSWQKHPPLYPGLALAWKFASCWSIYVYSVIHALLILSHWAWRFRVSWKFHDSLMKSCLCQTSKFRLNVKPLLPWQVVIKYGAMK